MDAGDGHREAEAVPLPPPFLPFPTGERGTGRSPPPRRHWSLAALTTFSPPSPHQVNEFLWNKSSNQFFYTTGIGTVEVLRYPQLDTLHSLPGHPASIYCITSDPTGSTFAVGGADALISVWDMKEMACMRTLPQKDPVRAVSFSHDGAFLASSGDDTYIDITHVASGASVRSIQCVECVNCVAFSPKQMLLAYVGEETQGSTGRAAAAPSTRRETGAVVKVLGFPPEAGGGGGGGGNRDERAFR